MKLLYDLTATQPSPESKFHGGGAYGEVVFFSLSSHHKKDVDLICYYDSSSYINPDIKELCRKKGISLFDIQETAVSKIIEQEKPDRFYSAMLNLNQNIPLEKTKVYATVHGLRTLELPFDDIMLEYATSLKEKIKYTLFMGIARNYYLKKLHAINGRLVTDSRINVITISNHSLFSIKSFYPEVKDKNIPVFASPTFSQLDDYCPAEISTQIEEETLRELNLTKKRFFLITSAARWNKNALRAVRAFDNLICKGFAKDFKVVVTGITHKEIFEKNIRNKESFLLLDYVDRTTLEILTKNEYAFIYPTLNEGFGYPPVEAMKYGVPSASSGSTSIPEVLHDAALYFDPRSVSEIENRILQLLDERIYTELSKKAFERYREVSKKQKEDLEGLVKYLLE